jgi:hypothetical protein
MHVPHMIDVTIHAYTGNKGVHSIFRNNDISDLQTKLELTHWQRSVAMYSGKKPNPAH